MGGEVFICTDVHKHISFNGNWCMNIFYIAEDGGRTIIACHSFPPF